jgi:hypothetical protein
MMPTPKQILAFGAVILGFGWLLIVVATFFPAVFEYTLYGLVLLFFGGPAVRSVRREVAEVKAKRFWKFQCVECEGTMTYSYYHNSYVCESCGHREYWCFPFGRMLGKNLEPRPYLGDYTEQELGLDNVPGQTPDVSGVSIR